MASRDRALLLQAPIGVMEATPDGVITFVNDAMATMLGRSTRDLLGTLGESLADPADAATNTSTVAQLRSGHGYVAERHYLAADGRSVPVHVSTTVLRDEHGAVSSVAAFVVDLTEITEDRAALSTALDAAAEGRDELIRRQRFTEALLETIDVGIVSCDATGGGLLRNRAERELLGLVDDQGGGPPESDASRIEILNTAGDPLAPNDFPLTRALEGRALDVVDFRIGPVGGPHRDVVIRGNQITASDGGLAGAVVAITDVTTERTMARELTLEHDRLNEAQRLGQLGSFTFDLASGEFAFSDQIYRIWGVQVGGDVASVWEQLIHPEDKERVMSGWAAAMREPGQMTTQYRIVRPDGSLRHLRVSIEAVQDSGGEVVALHGTHLDVTDLTFAQREAVQANKLFEAILSANPDFTFVTDIRTGAVIYGSPGKSILGIGADELERLGPAIIATLVHPEEQARLQAANRAARGCADGEVLNLRYRARHVAGNYHWLLRRVTPFRRDQATGEVIEVLGVVRDITDLVEAEERLTHTALHDPLTGLPNRSLLMDRLEVALGRSRQAGQDVAVLFCDLDGFKRVNDSAGHAAGDQVLVETARRIQAVLRDGDTVARVGGDEFVIIVERWLRAEQGHNAPLDTWEGLYRTSEDQTPVAGLAQRIIEAVRQPIVVDGSEHVVTASIGITYAGPGAVTTTPPLTADGVLQDADAAMYQAKRSGKDRFRTFEHGLRADLAERGRVEHVLRHALAHHDGGNGHVPVVVGTPRLAAAFQPIMDGGTGALVGFEALARLDSGDGVPISPDVFIDIAEGTNLIRPLGRAMLELACEQLATWRHQTPGLEHVTMAVNVSALEAGHGSWPDQVRGVLRAHGLLGEDLVLEITETALMHAANSTINALRGLREDGIGIALDDFGTGYASLRALATLPVSAVKVDRSFTAGLPHDPTSRKIVTAVARLAAELQIGCIIEGVETPDQLSTLPNGVQLQGYLFGRPTEPQDLDILSLTRRAGRRH